MTLPTPRPLPAAHRTEVLAPYAPTVVGGAPADTDESAHSPACPPQSGCSVCWPDDEEDRAAESAEYRESMSERDWRDYAGDRARDIEKDEPDDREPPEPDIDW